MQPDLRKWVWNTFGVGALGDRELMNLDKVCSIHNETVQLLKNAIEILADYVDKNSDAARIAEATRMIEENEHEQD